MGTRVRGWRWRRSPLRRRCDVVEAWALLTVVVLLVVGAPLAGVAVGWRVYDDARARAATQRAERHLAAAVIVEDAPAAVPSPTGRQPSYPVRVRWTDPGGNPRTGLAQVPAGARRGEHTRVWLESGGRRVGPPVNASAVWQHTLMAGLFTAGAAGAAVIGVHLAGGRASARRRLAAWERDWERTGPEWRRHTP
ncbi:Rv1733c family protein [Streptomyces sp. NPDC005122]